jgi:2-oxo-3-hexenedioate decarboxylase
MDQAAALAEILQARASSTLIAPVTSRSLINSPIASLAVNPAELDMSWAESCARQVLAGQKLIGMKLGLTSTVKQQTMGIAQPIFGYLSAEMLFSETVSKSEFRQPRLEPELVFKLTKNLGREISVDEVDEYAGEVAIGLELIDSSFIDYKFSLIDVVADNSSAAGFAVGEWSPISKLSSDAAVSFERDHQTLATTTASAILDNPRMAIVELSKYLAGRGQELAAGSLVLAGAMTDADPLIAGAFYAAKVAGLESIGVLVTP